MYHTRWLCWDPLKISGNTFMMFTIFNYLFTYPMCAGVLPACMPVYHSCAMCSWRPEEIVGSPGTGLVVQVVVSH